MAIVYIPSSIGCGAKSLSIDFWNSHNEITARVLTAGLISGPHLALSYEVISLDVNTPLPFFFTFLFIILQTVVSDEHRTIIIIEIKKYFALQNWRQYIDHTKFDPALVTCKAFVLSQQLISNCMLTLCTLLGS